MIPRFSLARPRSLPEAFAAYAAADGDAAWLAGGTELLQVMKMGLAQFGTLIDLKRLPELRGIERTNGTLRIGAAQTHREIERSEAVAAAVPALVGLERRIANNRVRNTGTLGGNLAFAEPHSDPATFLLACGATVEIAGPSGARRVGIDDFVLGPLATALEPGEIVTAVHISALRPGEGRAYEKIAFFERPAASVACRFLIGEGRVQEATVVVGSLTETPTRVDGAAAAFVGAEADAASLAEPLARATDVLGTVEAIDDLNGSPDFKRHLAGVLLGRAAVTALAEATRDA